MNGRGRVQTPDVLVGAVTAVAVAAASPAIYDLAGDLAAEAGPLGGLLLDLVVPMLFVGIIVSVSVSARRRPG